MASLTPWVTNLGLQNAFIVAAAAGLVQVSSFFIFVRFGRTLRELTAGRYRRYRDDMMAAGLVQ